MFGPRKILLQDIGIHTLWALIAGFIGSLLTLLIIFITSSFLDIPQTFYQENLGSERNPLFPFALSFITFIGTLSSIFLLSRLFSMTDPERYKRSSIVSWQLAFFGIITYICITPIYMYTWMIHYENIMLVFIIHCLILAFGSSLLLEILNNHSSILISFYACFLWVFFTTILWIVFFNTFESGYAKLISLLFLLPLILTSVTFLKWIFEFLYYQYYTWSNHDPLGDIFYQIERREQEEILEQTQKNTL